MVSIPNLLNLSHQFICIFHKKFQHTDQKIPWNDKKNSPKRYPNWNFNCQHYQKSLQEVDQLHRHRSPYPVFSLKYHTNCRNHVPPMMTRSEFVDGTGGKKPICLFGTRRPLLAHSSKCLPILPYSMGGRFFLPDSVSRKPRIPSVVRTHRGIRTDPIFSRCRPSLSTYSSIGLHRARQLCFRRFIGFVSFTFHRKWQKGICQTP